MTRPAKKKITLQVAEVTLQVAEVTVEMSVDTVGDSGDERKVIISIRRICTPGLLLTMQFLLGIVLPNLLIQNRIRNFEI